MQRGDPFGMPVSQGQAGVDQQVMTVLHQPMPDEKKLRLHPPMNRLLQRLLPLTLKGEWPV